MTRGPGDAPRLSPLLDYRPALVGRDGIGRYVRELVRALASRPEIAPRLFGATRSRPAFSRAALGLDGSAARLFAPRLPSKGIERLLASTRIGVERLVGGADVVHNTQYRRLPTRVPEVATVHDLVFLDSDAYVSPEVAARMSAFVRDAARRSAMLLTPSETVADEVAARLDVERERVVATPLGVDHVHRMARDPAREEALARDVRDRGPFVFTAARVEVRKNLEVVLRALEILGSQAPRWRLAGAPGYGAASFDEALRRSTARERVERLGAIDEASLRAELGACAAFVLVPFDEGFGLGPLEAMALGRPAITSDVPVVRELCAGGA
ncbi:MAG: glycosyltransferase family 1 protein, partial [Planctomycetota bacterium]